MQKKILSLCLAALSIGLPWHGAITVFLPDVMRWWKEFLLMVLLLGGCWLHRKWWKEKIWSWHSPLSWVVVFVAWGGFLLVIDFDYYALVSWRYLITGVVTLMAVYLIKDELREKNKEAIWYNFGRYFVPSLAVSIVFSAWAEWGGGFVWLADFYAQTISSWVPGQTIPIYHEIGDFVRWQGGTSGPVAFAHLLLLGIFVGLFCLPKKYPALGQVMMIILLGLGIIHSGSRAALGLGLMMLGVFGYWWYQQQKKWFIGRKQLAILSLIAMMIIGLMAKELQANEQFWQRDGTEAHWQKPYQAFKTGLQNPLLGNLGELGPGKRMKNLATIDDDKALVAENVWIDWWAQLGILGLWSGMMIFYSLGKTMSPQGKLWLITAMLGMMVATIFDMTPVSMAWFISFALLSKNINNRHKTTRSK